MRTSLLWMYQRSSNRHARSNDPGSNASTQFTGELVLKRSFFILLRIDYYLMMLSCLGTLERVMRDLEEEVEVMMTSKDVQQKSKARSNMISSLPRPLGPVYLKLVTQGISGLCFQQSTYGWKANLIRKPI